MEITIDIDDPMPQFEQLIEQVKAAVTAGVLKPGQALTDVIPSMEHARPVDEFIKAIAEDLQGRLVASGLFEKEARAMVNTWRSSYFKPDGVRVLFVLPQSWTDRFIPIDIKPKPAELIRVMVGRVELLDPSRERRASSGAPAGRAQPDP